MVGLSAGGHIAYYAATEVPLAALVAFYPGWLTTGEIALYTAEDRARIARESARSGPRHEVVLYPDTPHGFFCDERDTYRPEAAADAWSRTVALLREASVRE
ncbi:dienelactone hydrolase family protein [Embleya sp. NPDC055664]|uniref:dienelactone hydrolase family protein n=1 Tax=Embleya sp. NPDC059237 TaxID=3346784 RepID=UPI0036AABBE0